MRIWKCWHPHLHVISIDAEVVDTKRHECPERTAVFFSGGVDSFFTLLWHSDNNNSSKRFHINDLLCIWGFDVPLSNQKAFFQMRERLEKVAFSFDKELIDIATNLRDTRWQKTDWGYLSHGCALVSVALSLEKRFSKILIGSTGGYKDLNPWGSHIITDPLLSTSMTEIIHDGAFFNRVQKTEFVAKSEVALKSLRVCWKSRSDENCCACNKCYRTMITLELLGELDRCSTFNISKVDIGKVEKVYSPHYYDIEYYSEISSLAVSKGRLDISKAIDRSLKNSSRLNRLLKIIRSLQNKRFVWRFAQPLEEILLSHYIT
jgi:hypothetical protein